MKGFVLIVIALTSIGICAQAQYPVIGRVTDANDKSPIPYAGAVLLQADSSVVKGVTTNRDGSFVIENVAAGSYLLRIVILGYETEYRNVNVPLQSDLGEIALVENVTQIDEVTVTAEGRGRVEANTGYGTVLARDMIEPGTVVQYTPNEARMYRDLVDLFRATVPGVRISVDYRSGIALISIHGGAPASLSSLSIASSEPLIIVDGLEIVGNATYNPIVGFTSPGAFQIACDMIHPGMVKNITVHKNGSMFGSRGGNGAIIITTFTPNELLDARDQNLRQR